MSVVNRISVWDDEDISKTNASEPSNKSIWKPFYVGLLISLSIGVIAFAVVTTLWIQVK